MKKTISPIPKTIFMFFVLSFSMTASAFDCEKASTLLAKTAKQVNRFSTYGDSYDEKKLAQANALLTNDLKRYTQDVGSLDCQFKELNKIHQLSFITSDDNRLRVFSWDRETGGTLHYFSGLLQFKKSDGGVQIINQPDFALVTDLFTVSADSYPNTYILVTTVIASTKLNLQLVEFYQETAHGLEKVKLIETTEGLADNVGLEYDFFSVYKSHDERPIKLIKFNKETNTLSLPVIEYSQEFRDGKVTDEFIDYHFNGRFFEKLGQ